NAYWENLREGRDCVTEIPAERWSLDGFYCEDVEQAVAQGRSYAKWGGFVESFAQFDPLFFNLSPRDAEDIDPQERLFLETCWHVIEDAGYTRDRIARRHGSRVGVFVGVTKTGFDLHGPGARRDDPLRFPHTSFSSVANRVSYFLNLHGPSLPIDTMCSSSLTAIHEACEHLLRDECELAIAGGVNLYLHPSNYVELCRHRMLSPRGRCRSFGEGGDGMVPGEGVGAVLLKRLGAAEADGDRIHGVIRASAINHGGKTNGFTVPNPNAQAELIVEALTRGGIDSAAVAYLEAHGTGTALGDPIEIAGLVKAFAQASRQPGERIMPCAIGSVKSNIGHAESAAGIAGLTKVLLQMRHGELAPSLHADHTNPLIDFGATPFRVQRELARWPRARATAAGIERELPRLAGISSFGAGGANAHLIVEEYLDSREYHQADPREPVAIVLSAREQAPLREAAQRLLAALRRGDHGDATLGEIAFTLQTGREAFEHRLAFVAGSIDEAIDELERFAGGEASERGRHQGDIRAHHGALAVFAGDEDAARTLDSWLDKRKYARLLEAWTQGVEFDWQRLYAGRRMRVASLPGYPFARERYWIRQAEAAAVETGPSRHPLLHENSSTLYGQRFDTWLDGSEWFLADHQVGGARVLPGVAYLEMARAAVQASLTPPDGGAAPAVALTHVAWSEPLVHDGAGPLQVRIGLEASGAGAVRYEVYREVEGVRTVHGQGYASTVDEADVPGPLDLGELLSRVEAWRSGEACYAGFDASGIHYGPAHRGLVELGTGRDAQGLRFALGRLRVPDAAAGAGSEAYVLHPSLLDSALQAGAGLDEAEAGLSLPFALDRIRIHARPPREAYVVVREAAGSGETTSKRDLTICDAQGQVSVVLEGLTSRAHRGEGAQLLAPVWQDAPREAQGDGKPRHARRYVLVDPALLGSGSGALEALGAALPGVELSGLALEQAEADPAAAFGAALEQLLGVVGELLRERDAGDVLLQVAVRGGETAAWKRGLAGLLKTAREENPRISAQLIEIDGLASIEALSRTLDAEAHGEAAEIHHAGDGRRLDLDWQPLAETERVAADASPWRDGGVYLITGGAGGLGRLFAREIASRTRRATLVLSGRSELDAEAHEALRALAGEGDARVEYRRLDLGDAAAVRAAVDSVVADHGRLDGVLHSAGLLRDAFLFNKQPSQLREVLAPKVAGLQALDAATAALRLDFLVSFSSTAAVFGNVGQADYASANGFMDGFAAMRNARVRGGQRHGRTLSINWPLWAQGGMRVDAATVERLRERYGVRPLSSEAGLAAFYRAFASGLDQVCVLPAGQTPPARAGAPRVAPARPVMSAATATVPTTVTTPTATENDALAARAIEYFRKWLAAQLKVGADQLDDDAPLDRYGIDSVRVMQLTSALESRFGPLSKTLFFEYRNVAELSRHFVQAHRERMLDLLGLASPSAAPLPTSRPAGPAPRPVPSSGPAIEASFANRLRFARAARAPADGPAGGLADTRIAIVGLGGRYPQANDLDAFWDNLESGRDAITEIPPERWALTGFYDAGKDRRGMSYSKWGGFLDGVDEFDPLFFNISPREAQLIDPQERLFLQCAYHTLEDAGHTRESLGTDRVGVFVGVMYEEYPLLGVQTQCGGGGVALNGNPSSIANRVSYCFDFRGPSMAVDTMCSSSLTAIHLARESLLRGECDAALAGGVNVSIHPNKYLSLSQGHFASSDGRCRSFGAGGDGYVPGEGVGAVLLRRIDDALADGDVIHALIRGSSINHGGKTNGYTVPNPGAQRELIEAALAAAGVRADEISYVEAHGTGTELGDPIEIAGLTQAFGDAHAAAGRRCAIGSVKSNIGHAESAAGIAGLTKVLLQMRHGRLVPSLHADTLNPHIDFERTALRVQRELADWVRPRATAAGIEHELPRIAGISSFGAGGANAHLIVEEYAASTHDEAGEDAPRATPEMIVLSARTPAALRGRIARLRDALARRAWRDAELPALAYTLQVGREAHEHRFACLAGSIDELVARLVAALDGAASGAEDGMLWFGEVRRGEVGETMALLGSADELRATLDDWIARGRLDRLLALWVRGLRVDWRALMRERPARRVSLPGYPFARERYWIRQAEAAAVETGPSRHPLLHENSSTLYGQRFDTWLDGSEWFLADHRVGGARVLPGVAYLEMARAAVQASLTPPDGGAAPAVALTHVAWSEPLVHDGAGPLQVRIGLEASGAGAVRYEVYREVEGVRTVHGQGYASTVDEADVPGPLDLGELLSRVEAWRSGEACYAGFDASGIHYGPAHRGLVELGTGRDAQGLRFALGRLRVPDAAAGAGSEAYVLHPSLLDSALQAGAGLDEAEAGLSLPFALDRIRIHARPPREAYVVVREAAGSGKTTSKRDLTICDAQGQVSVVLEGLTSRAHRGEGAQLLAPVWQDAPREAQGDGKPRHARRYVLVDPALLGSGSGALEALGAALPGVELSGLALEQAEADPAAAFGAALEQLLGVVGKLLRERDAGDVLLQVAVRGGETAAWKRGLAGLLKTAREENPRISAQLIEIEPAMSAIDLAACLDLEADADPEVVERRHAPGSGRSELGWLPSTPSMPEGLPWREGGVYLITGGAGGLGRLFAREIASRTRRATLVLSGRSELDAEAREALRALAGEGDARVEYRRLDLGDAAAVRAAVDSVVADHGRLDGVLHSAGLLRDAFLFNKQPSQLREVLAPKVAGLQALDAATAALRLDFLVSFSSTAAVFGNVGQADYASANGFMDGFAAMRNARVRGGQRHGRTLSINWPLWAQGGMRVDAATAERLRERYGVRPLSSEAGLAAFYRAFASGLDQVCVLPAGQTPPARAAAPVTGTASGARPDPLEEPAHALIERIANGTLSETEFEEWILA
uniref:SDR family NAD(P)-dependent oxidoreductase n=1 Tax=Burkholderia gladioli TaxID=28095 RepID=UPI00163FA9C4